MPRLRRLLAVLLMLLVPLQAWAAMTHGGCSAMAQQSATPAQSPDHAMMGCHESADTRTNTAPDADNPASGCQHCAACLLAPGLPGEAMPMLHGFTTTYRLALSAGPVDFLTSTLDRPPRPDLG